MQRSEGACFEKEALTYLWAAGYFTSQTISDVIPRDNGTMKDCLMARNAFPEKRGTAAALHTIVLLSSPLATGIQPLTAGSITRRLLLFPLQEIVSPYFGTVEIRSMLYARHESSRTRQ